MTIKQIVSRSIADQAITGAKINTTNLTTSNVVEGTNLYYTDARTYSNTALLNYITAASLDGYSTNSQLTSYATTTHVSNELANLVSSAPSTLDTLNELAAALGDDPSFATTVATSIGNAYNQANVATTNASSAFNQANTATTNASIATTNASSAFNKANTLVATVAGVTSTSISNTNLLDGLKTVDGVGSGLDADLIDGINSTAIVYGTSGAGTSGVSTTQDLTELGHYKSGFWDTQNASWTPTTDWYWGGTFAHRSNGSNYNYGGQIAFKNSGGGDYVYLRTIAGGATPTASTWRKIWTDGNDGAGSGLDADTLDGIQAASFAQLSGAAFTGAVSMGANTILSANASTIGRVDLGSCSSNTTVNIAISSYFTATATGNFTFTFSGAASGTVMQVLVIELTNGGDYTVGWPTSVKWPADTAPTLTSGGTDLLIFLTDNNGTTWRGTSQLAYTT